MKKSFGKIKLVDGDFDPESTLKDFKKIKPSSSKVQRIVQCNLCGKTFKVKSKFERFCNECKMDNEEYQAYNDYRSVW